MLYPFIITQYGVYGHINLFTIIRVLRPISQASFILVELLPKPQYIDNKILPVLDNRCIASFRTSF